MGSQSNCVNIRLKTGGTVAVRGEEVADCSDQCYLGISGIKLKNKDGWFGCSDPFYKISRVNEDGSYALVWQSETIMNDLSPNFKPRQIQVQKLCNGDYFRPLRIEFYDWDADGTHDFMGLVDTTLKEMCDGVGKPSGRMPVSI